MTAPDKFTVRRFLAHSSSDSVPNKIAVALVVTPQMSDELLRALADRVPVWIVKSEDNERVTRQVWQSVPKGSVTLFDASPPDAPAEQELEIVPTIDMHSSEYGPVDYVGVLEVVGLSITTAAENYLRTQGFDQFESTVDGFKATRTSGPY